MKLLDQIRRDARKFVSNSNDFATEIEFSMNGNSAKVNGTIKKHHIQVDDNGNAVNSLNSTCTISELDLIEQGYIVRNINKEVSLRNNTVKFKDALGNESKYSIVQWFPDEHLGLIVCILGEYGS